MKCDVHEMKCDVYKHRTAFIPQNAARITLEIAVPLSTTFISIHQYFLDA